MKRPHSQPPLPSKDDLLAFIGEQSGKSRHPRDRARLRAEERRPRRAQAHAARARRRGPRRAAPQEAASSRHPAPGRARRHTARDADGELIAVPTEWDEAEHGPPPKIRVRVPRRARPSEVAGVGDRALLRVEESGDKDDPIRHSGRVIKLIDRARQRVLGIFRALPGRRRTARADRQEAARPRARDPARRRRRTRETAIWSRSRWRARRSGYGLADRARDREARLAQDRARGQPDRHPRPPHPAMYFRRPRCAEAEAAKPARLAGREDWRELPLVTIDPRRRQGSRRRRARDARSRPEKSRRLRHQRRHRGRRPLRAAGLGARPRGARARQFGLFPRPGGADAAGAHLQRSLLAAARRGSRRARGADRGRRRRPQALAQLPPRAHALGRAS